MVEASNGQTGEEQAPIIQVTGLKTQFGNTVIHENLDFSVQPGEVMGLVGGSGTGKSVLLRTIVGLNKQREGRIVVFGQDLGQIRPAAVRDVQSRWGVLFQDGALFSSLTVAQNIEVPMKENSNLPAALRHELIEVKIAMVGLPPDAAHKYPAELSGGMRKRAGLARALALDAEIVFLDEPTAGLDPDNARRVRDLVRDLAGQRTLVLSSHNLHEIQDLCDRVAILHRGRVAESGSLEQLTRAAFQLRIALGSAPTEAAQKLLEGLDAVVRVELREAGELHVHLAAAAPAERDAAVKQVLVCLLERDLVPRSLHQGASLEARFLEITGSDAAGSD